jgi:polyphosphate kinase 2 (PPK2 family)
MKITKGQEGSPAQIRDVVMKVEPKTVSADPKKQIQEIQDHLKKREKEEIIKQALKFHYETEELKPYQSELIKLQRYLEKSGKKMVILFDGRDASGKGGTIRRITRYMNEKRYRVVALGKPTENGTPYQTIYRALPPCGRDRPVRQKLVQPGPGGTGNGILHRGPIQAVPEEGRHV